jgi:hypothetical protein
VAALKKVLLPTFGLPTTPISMPKGMRSLYLIPAVTRNCIAGNLYLSSESTFSQ